MTPRRLLPYLLVFLVLAATYVTLKLVQERRETREKQAKKVFQIKEGEVAELAVLREKEEIRLSKKDQEWRLLKPLQTRADQDVMAAVLTTLAHLEKERDLGPEKDLKSFGLDKPSFTVEFSAQGQTHRLIVGGKAPGDRSYYALKDQDTNLLLIRAIDKDSLDRPLSAWRDKTLLFFTPDRVKGLKLTSGNTAVELRQTGPHTWSWVGKEGLKVRGDRVEALLRHLNVAKVKEFVSDSPKDLRSYGLAPKPQAQVVIIPEQGEETLALGNKAQAGVYARKGAQGPVVLVDPDLLGLINRTLSNLEDRRLWAGPVTEAGKVVWGPPQESWTAVKDQDGWKLTGPEGKELRQSNVRLEMTLWKLSGLEYQRLLPAPAGPAAKGLFRLEVFDGAGKSLFSLEELGKKGEAEVETLTRQGDKTATALIPLKNYTALKEEVKLLTTPPRKKE